MIAVKTVPNPETLRYKTEIADTIAQLEELERLRRKPVGIVKRQNLSLGSSYDMVTAEEASAKLGKWEGSEIYLEFWPKQYFCDLANKYK